MPNDVDITHHDLDVDITHDMTLFFLGAPRTASKSLWMAFKKHPEIACSIEKEPFNSTSKKILFASTKRYLKMFNVLNEKVLVDATPCAYFYYYDIVKRMELPIKIIYVLRNPYDRIYSTIKQTIITHSIAPFKKTAYPDFIIGRKKIDKNKIMDFIPTLLDGICIEHAFKVTRDILMVKLEDIIEDLTPIYNFMGVQPINIKLPHYNKMTIWKSKIFDGVREDVEGFFTENKDEINEMIEKDRKKWMLLV